MFGFVDGHLPLGYMFDEDGAVVEDPDVMLVLDELHALAIAA